MSESVLAINNYEIYELTPGRIKRLCQTYKKAIDDELFRQIISALNQINPDDKIVMKSCCNVLSNIYNTFKKKKPSQQDLMQGRIAQDNFNCEAITYCCIGTGCIACGLPCLLIPPLCTANPMTTLPLISEGVGALCTIGGCCMDMAACKLSALTSTLSSIQEIEDEMKQLTQNKNLPSGKTTIAQYQQKLTNILNAIDQLAPSANTKENVCELIYDVLEINECMQALNLQDNTTSKDDKDKLQDVNNNISVENLEYNSNDIKK